MRNMFWVLFSAVLILGCSKVSKSSVNFVDGKEVEGLEKAVFAGGCFWCLEAPFESIDGVKKVVSGYAGNKGKQPTYEEVSSGKTGMLESVEVYYDPALVSFSELLDIYWKQFDPTDEGGSFYDRGEQYTSAVFYMNEEQKKTAEESKQRLQNSGIFKNTIATKIQKFEAFYPAEDYHQNYYKKNPDHYYSYRKSSGRDEFILGLWGDENIEKYKKAVTDDAKKKLTPLQYEVTQNMATEPPYKNEFVDHNEEGIYVDVVSGEPLYSSKDKIDCGSGWPSFSKPIDTRFIQKREDKSHGMQRVEVRSKFGDSHLGHVFNDGPAPTNLRYCINSASLRFVPKDKMEKEGYGEYLWLFK